MNTLILNAKIPDFAQKSWTTADLAVFGGKIVLPNEIGRRKGIPTINAGGRPLLPAFADLRTHIFAPPHIRVESGDILRRSAAAGGYYTLLAAPCAPDPVTSPATVQAIASLSDSRKVRVLPTGAIADRKGRPSDAKALLDAGAFALADDGFADLLTLHAAMRLCAERDRLFILHAGLNPDLPGIDRFPQAEQSRFSENFSTAQALICAQDTGCRLHITGVSTAQAIGQIRAAKAAGVSVTCDSPPPYFTMTKSDLYFYGAKAMLCHPLRERADQQAILAAVVDGTIDAISTDHTPVETSDKADIKSALPGMLALQTTFSVCLTHLVLPGHIDLFRLIDLLSLAPLRILGLPDRMEAGEFCPLVLCDLDRSYTFTESMLISKPNVKNSPYVGQVLTGSTEKLIL